MHVMVNVCLFLCLEMSLCVCVCVCVGRQCICQCVHACVCSFSCVCVCVCVCVCPVQIYPSLTGVIYGAAPSCSAPVMADTQEQWHREGRLPAQCRLCYCFRPLYYFYQYHTFT